MAWIVGRGASRVELRTDREPAGSGRRRFADMSAARAFLRRFADDPFDAATLRAVARQAVLGRGAADERAVADVIAAELVAGRLIVADGGPREGGTTRPRPPEPPGDLFEQLGRGQDTEWVEIQLVDEAGRGVPGARYVVVAPDGREFRGYTDGIGAARITRIPGGACKVRFPDIDGRDWRPE